MTECEGNIKNLVELMLKQDDHRIGFGYNQTQKAVALIHPDLYREYEGRHYALVEEYA